MSETKCFERCPFFGTSEPYYESFGPNGEAMEMREPPTCYFDGPPYADALCGMDCPHGCGLAHTTKQKMPVGEELAKLAAHNRENRHLDYVVSLIDDDGNFAVNIETKEAEFIAERIASEYIPRYLHNAEIASIIERVHDRFALLPRYTNTDRTVTVNDTAVLGTKRGERVHVIIKSIEFTENGIVIHGQDTLSNDGLAWNREDLCALEYYPPADDAEGNPIYIGYTVYDMYGKPYSVYRIYADPAMIMCTDNNGRERRFAPNELYVNYPGIVADLADDELAELRKSFEEDATKLTYVALGSDETKRYIRWMVTRAIDAGADKDEAMAAFDSTFSDLDDLVAEYGYKDKE